MTNFELPPNFFDPAMKAYHPYWEQALRKAVADQPDPAKRFTEWLEKRASGESTPGNKLIFFEQPYLDWADAVDRVVERSEKDLRASIAYEIENPNEDR